MGIIPKLTKKNKKEILENLLENYYNVTNLDRMKLALVLLEEEHEHALHVTNQQRNLEYAVYCLDAVIKANS